MVENIDCGMNHKQLSF